MLYYSTNGKAEKADLQKAVVKGLAEDRGLYMPEVIHQLPKAFFDEMPRMKFQDIAFNVASAFFVTEVQKRFMFPASLPIHIICESSSTTNDRDHESKRNSIDSAIDAMPANDQKRMVWS